MRRFLQRHWAGLAVLVALGAFLSLAAWLGFGWRDVAAIGRFLRHGRAPQSVALQASGAEAPTDLHVAGGRILALREGVLLEAKGGILVPLTGNEGLLRFFPDAVGTETWLGGTYGRLMHWGPTTGLRFATTLPGGLREVRQAGDRLYVAYDLGESQPLGRVRAFRVAPWGLEATGLDLPIALDRWSGFALSPDGALLLANQVGGRAVGLWSVEDGALRASWPTERLARLLWFTPAGDPLFDLGPPSRGRDAAYPEAANRLVWVPRSGGAPVPVIEGFARILAVAPTPDGRAITFGDMAGLVRHVDLSGAPRPCAPFTPRPRGVPWRLRHGQDGLWALVLKGPEARIARFAYP